MTVTATRPPTGSTSQRRRAVLVGVVALVVVAAAVVVWLTNRGPGSAPYDDPASSGALTLCRDGKAVTEGKTTGFPFVTTVAGATAATGAYAGEGGTATLFAYQPRAGVDAAEWTGLQLTPARTYARATVPALTLARQDTTLGQFLGGYPALDKGWVQLRLYLGAPGVPASQTYASADLHVDGSTWRQVGGGHATCPASTAPSN